MLSLNTVRRLLREIKGLLREINTQLREAKTLLRESKRLLHEIFLWAAFGIIWQILTGDKARPTGFSGIRKENRRIASIRVMRPHIVPNGGP